MFRPMSVALVLTLAACKKPPEAPADLDQLCNYLYSHMPDDDPEYLQVGLESLLSWLDVNIDETYEGYSVSALSQETVQALDDLERDVEDVEGAAVGTDGVTSVDDMAWVLVMVNPSEYIDNHEVYERSYDGNQQCFVERGCDWLEMTNYMESSYTLGLTVTSENTANMRWVELDEGPALLHRTWLNGPAQLNWDWLSIDENYYLNVVLPRGTGHRRLQATWMSIDVGSGDLPEALALNLVIGSMQSDAEAVDAYLQGSGD